MHNNVPQTPAHCRLYAIGDIHGRKDLLDQLLNLINEDAKTAHGLDKILILLGDYIDRGPDSQGVLDRLADLQAGRILKGFKFHFLKGNHEEAMLSFLSSIDAKTWLSFGGQETVESYGLNAKQPPEVIRKTFLQAMPMTHRHILRDLEFRVVYGDYAFVHAGIRPGVSWADQKPDDLLWIREDFCNFTQPFEYMMVHGHTPVQEPTIKANRIAIDTRAWTSNLLSCLVLQGTEQRFLQT